MRNKILRDRYLQPGETEDDMYRRVAKFVMGDNYHPYQHIMKNGEFLPNTPTLVNAGAGRIGTLSACYVLPIDDSLEAIFKTSKDQALIHQYFGGTGFSFSRLRPKGFPIKSTGGKATGPVGFMELYNVTADVVKQGGHREGGNMAILRVDHPDIEEFITCKTQEGVLRHMNISVAITDEFMDAVRNNSTFGLTWNNVVVKYIDAVSLFNKIVESAWGNGEPGIVFIDEMNRHNPTPHLGYYESTNPCGEQPLLPYESCNLGSINLAKMVKDGEVDWDRLKEVTQLATIFLDRVIDVNTYPIPEVRDTTLLTRKIGLGVMGWHDMLIHLGIPYAGQVAYSLAEKVMSEITMEAVHTSQQLAKDVGPYPAFNEGYRISDIRNATCTTIAPTGSISLITNCSSGIQPVFAWRHTRTIESGTFNVEHPTYKEAKEKGLFECGTDISWEAHVRTQAAFQKYTHNAVSITVNMPQNAKPQDITSAIFLAHELKCKGITFYRMGSRKAEVLTVKKKLPSVRPRKVSGDTFKIRTGCGAMFVTLNKIEGTLYETIIPNSSGGCQSLREGLGRLVTRALKQGDTIDGINEELQKCKCVIAMQNPKSECKSCPAGLGNLMLEETGGTVDNRPRCPNCNQLLEYEGGCRTGTCKSCGWGGCS